MNRLKKHTCYLVGPMDHARDDGRAWRDEIGKFLEDIGVIVLNPYSKPLRKDTHSRVVLEDDENFKYIIEARNKKDYDEITRRFKQVRAIDLRFVDKSDFIVAFLNFDVLMTGTMEEIFTANRQRKPVIILSSKPKNEMPPWYFGAFPHEVFFETIDQVKEYIRHIDQDENIDLLGNRWVFFDC